MPNYVFKYDAPDLTTIFFSKHAPVRKFTVDYGEGEDVLEAFAYKHVAGTKRLGCTHS